MAKELTYTVTKKIGKLGDDSDKELRIVSWNGRDGKLDVRSWWTDKEGNEKCGKGVALTNDEAKVLVDLLNDYLNDEDDTDF